MKPRFIDFGTVAGIDCCGLGLCVVSQGISTEEEMC
jgi:hypothetical protein